MRGYTISKTWPHDPTAYAPARHRRACRYDAFVPEPLGGVELAMDGEVAGIVSDAEQAVRDLESVAHPFLAPLARLLLRTESIASSRVEGMQMDARDLARAEARAETGREIGSGAQAILANIDAMERAIEEASAVEAVGVDEITGIHGELLSKGLQNAIAGRIREGQNWIGGNDYNPCGADFVPPPPEHVAPLLEDLCRAMAEETLPPLVQAALVHAQFETIHPFDDGNGRTGRALIHVVLRRRGLATTFVPPVSVAFAADRDRYIEGLTRYRDDDLDGWIGLFAAATARAARLAGEYVERVRALMEAWRERLAQSAAPRADAAAWAVIDVLPAHPVITLPVATVATGRAKSAVHAALGQLEDAGVLEPLSEARRNRAWEAAGLLELMAGLEAGERL